MADYKKETTNSRLFGGVISFFSLLDHDPDFSPQIPIFRWSDPDFSFQLSGRSVDLDSEHNDDDLESTLR